MHTTNQDAVSSYKADFNRSNQLSHNNKIALRIIKKSREFNISIFESESLSSLLLSSEIDDFTSTEISNTLHNVFKWLHNTQQKAQLS